MKYQARPRFYEYCCKSDAPILLKDYLQTVLGYSSRVLRSVVHDGTLQVNGKKHWLNEPVVSGDTITLMLPEEDVDMTPTAGPLEIVYEDDEVLVVSKDADVVTHPTRRHPTDTLGNLIAHYFIQTGQHCKIRFVSRLDRDTSGIVVTAKNKYVHHYLQSHQVIPKPEKTYIAFVEGIPEKQTGTIRAPIRRDDGDGIHRIVSGDGKPSVTHYQVLKTYGDKAAKVKLLLETGRTHQIRVHMAHIGCPLIGDHLYNEKRHIAFSRTALHSYKMTLSLPKTGEHTFIAPLKKDLKALEAQLNNII